MSGSAVTPPKGRATRARNDHSGQRSIIGPTLQWVLVVIAAVLVMGAIFYFGRDIRSNYGGGGHSGAPAPVPALVADVVIDASTL